MKFKSLTNLFIISLITILFACNQEPKTVAIELGKTEELTKEKVEVLAENKAEVNFEVEGMVCAMGCAKYIEEQVADLDGVVLSTVDFEEGLATIQYDKSKLDANELEDFINEIHDGQYDATILSEEELLKRESEEAEVEEADEDRDEDLAQVTERIKFSFPELLTYFLKRL